MGNVGAEAFNFGFLTIVAIALVVIATALICIVRKVTLSPWMFWVLTLGMCIVSVTMAIMGYESTAWECLVLAAIAFCIGCVAEIFKK